MIRPKGKKLNLRQKKQVKRLIGNQEEPKFDISSFAGTIVATAAINDHFTPPQALTDGGRVGDQCNLKSISWKVQLIKDPASAAAFELLRIIFFQWKPSSANLVPTAAQLLLTDATTGTITYRSMYNHDHKQSYSILSDRVYVMTGATATTLNSNNVQYHRGVIKHRRFAKKVQFNAASIAGSNKIYCLLIGNNTVTPPTYNIHTEIFYTD